MLIRIVPTDRLGIAIDTDAASFAALTLDPRRIDIGRINNTGFGAALTNAVITGASDVLVEVVGVVVEVVVEVVDVEDVSTTDEDVSTTDGGTVVGAIRVGATVVGSTVVGAIVVGSTVVGAAIVVGTTLRVAIAVADEAFIFDLIPN